MMKGFVVLGAVGLTAVLLAPACGSDDSAKKVRERTAQGGEGGDGAAGEPTSGGSPAGSSGDTGDSGSGGVPANAGGAEAGGVSSGGAPQGSAGEAAAGSAGEGGGGGGSGGVTGNVVYASFGTKLVWIEPETGKLHEVGDMRNTQGTATYTEVLFGYGGVPGQAQIITPRYAVTGTPQLGKLDLCTGIISDLVTVTRTGNAPTVIESLARHPNGTWYVSTGAFPAGPQQSQSNRMGTIDVTTSVVTDLSGTINTLQDDIDSSAFVGTTLYAIDVATNTSQLELVTINLMTGVATSIATPSFGTGTATPLRMAYDESRGKAYAWRPSDRNLLELSLINGTVTPIGETHPADVYPGAVSQAMMVAPVCP